MPLEAAKRTAGRPEAAKRTAARPEAVCCDYCGRMIGVYEPLVVFDEGQARETSRAQEPGLSLTAMYFHRACYTTL